MCVMCDEEELPLEGSVQAFKREGKRNGRRCAMKKSGTKRKQAKILEG